MRYLVVNADDFGSCSGVNRGIVEAHRRGIVTSASLMVAMPASREAARLARGCPALDVGLHASFTDARRRPVVNLADPGACRVSLDEQVLRFAELLDRWPTHLDTHHHVHMRPGLLPHFREVAALYGVPLRNCSGVRYCSRFYGQWDGESHPEQLTVASLIRILETDGGDGVTELGCHPGYPDRALVSSYTDERELELRTLCDGRVRRFLDRCSIGLAGFGEVSRLLGMVA
jgi:predicted glycoside hydrolase/deacetylase ChbG (UPF0249 family)